MQVLICMCGLSVVIIVPLESCDIKVSRKGRELC